MANLYFTESTPDEAFRVGATIEVAGDEARHAVAVSRLRVGERVRVGNGAGVIGEGVVDAASKSRFTVVLEQVHLEPERGQTLADAPRSNPRVTLVQALAKGDRAERAIEQSTEFGVDAIVPWQAARSVSRWGGADSDKAGKGRTKWSRVAREAAKQSVRARVPSVAPVASLTELTALASLEHTRLLVLHPRGADSLSAWAASELTADARITEVYVVVGPEGGISDAELDELQAAGASVLRLGDAVLRTSSAGPAAFAVLNIALGRW